MQDACRTLFSEQSDHYVAVIFVFLFLGGLAWTAVSVMLDRQTAKVVIRESGEYQCIAAAGGKEPSIRWSSLGNLKQLNTSFTIGTLIEKPGVNCIENGDAVSFAMLPEGPSASLSAIRIRGREVRAEYREKGQWADVTDATGTERWRNDGDGYRRISP